MIKCFSNVVGHKEAQELVIDLNQMKSDESEGFYIKYDKNQDYSKDDNYLVVGNVTQEDWDELNLDVDLWLRILSKMTSEIYLDDSMVRIQHNPNLKNKPFLVEIFTFDNEPYQIRFSKDDLELLTGFINRTIVNT